MRHNNNLGAAARTEVELPSSCTRLEPIMRGTPVSLKQPLEERGSRAKVPNHLNGSQIYAKLKNGCPIEAEPSELHFSGFELGKDHVKILKVINVTTDVMDIHIVPTQTKHFQTTDMKKYRLIPGLPSTLEVRFCPDEWRHFFDCVQVHCQGEEKFLIPVHGFPDISCLHLPPHIDLPAVPLGQSVQYSIPLSSCCPMSLEFRILIIQPHEAITISPLAGIISTNSQREIMVTFKPLLYETSQVIIQFDVALFSSKPCLCTITGSTTPPLTLSQMVLECSREGVAPRALPTLRKSKRFTKKAYKPKIKSEADAKMKVKPSAKPVVDVFTPAGVAKLLITDTDKLIANNLKDVVPCGSTVTLRNRQIREALFVNNVQQVLREERISLLRRRIHLGQGPLSERSRRQILEQREITWQQYMVKRGDMREEDEFHSGPPKLFIRRVLCETGEVPEDEPTFAFYSGFQLELRKRLLKLFQQAARKLVIQCRMNRRLVCLRKLPYSMRSLAQTVVEDTSRLKTSQDKVVPLCLPTFLYTAEHPTTSKLSPLLVQPLKVSITPHVPFFRLQVPQHCRRMGYQPVSVWEAFDSYLSPSLNWPLHSGALDELLPEVKSTKAEKLQHWQPVKMNASGKEPTTLTFTAPDALLQPFPANPLQIFNPGPGLQAYKPTPKYLESDLEFHLCPVPRYADLESSERETQFAEPLGNHLDNKNGVVWRNFDSAISNCLFSIQDTPTNDGYLQRFVDYSEDILLLSAPAPLACPPGDLAELQDERAEESGLLLTPQMIRAEFLSGETLPPTL